MTRGAITAFSLALLMASLAQGAEFVAGKRATVTGYVVASSCKFDKNIKQPVSTECVRACAKAGSPFLIRADNGHTYWPILMAPSSQGQKSKLMPLAGQRITVRGMVYEDSRFGAIVIETIEELSTPLVARRNQGHERSRRRDARMDLP